MPHADVFTASNNVNRAEGEGLCMIRTNQNMLTLATENQATLDIPCLPSSYTWSSASGGASSGGDAPEGSACWTAGWGKYIQENATGTSEQYQNQEFGSIHWNRLQLHYIYLS